MIKLLLILFLITTTWASDDKKASNIFNLIAMKLTDKSTPTIYLHKGNSSLEKYPGNLNITTECAKADLVILSTIKDIPKECLEKVLFGTRYSHLKNKNVVGSFFWQKGRPNILFYKQRLKEHKIKLDSSFDRYIEN